MSKDTMVKTGKSKIILKKRGVEYIVLESDEEGRGPWFEGSTFRAFEGNPVDGHFFVEHDYTGGSGGTTDTIVGVAHNRRELAAKLYHCAKAYSVKNIRVDEEFVDETKRRSKT